MRRAAASLAAFALAFALPVQAALVAPQGVGVDVRVSSTVPDDEPPLPPPSGGGGGSGSATAQTGVTVSGRAYPMSVVSVLRDGALAAQTIAGPDAVFSVTLTRIGTGAHTISVMGEDDKGRTSVLFSFPITVTAGATTNVSGIFISPTIDTDKVAVRQGDPIAVFGQTVPGAQVTITVHSDEVLTRKVAAEADGAYLYYVDTTPLAYGDHVANSFSGTDNLLSSQSPDVDFSVGTENVARAGSSPATDTCRKGDINCDGHVDLIDYSILAYWYQRAGTLPERVDVSGDGTVTLTDFSIVAYYWTG